MVPVSGLQKGPEDSFNAGYECGVELAYFDGNASFPKMKKLKCRYEYESNATKIGGKTVEICLNIEHRDKIHQIIILVWDCRMENISLHFSSKEVEWQVQVLLKLMDGLTESFQNCQDNI